jgi:hypothetical protein
MAISTHYMRISIRTILILTAIAGVIFARISHLRRMAAYHRWESAIAAQRVSSLVGESYGDVCHWARKYGNPDADGNVNPWGNPWDLETEDLAKDWKGAVYHEAMASAFDRSMLLPVAQITLEPVDSPAAERARRPRKWPFPRFDRLSPSDY